MPEPLVYTVEQAAEFLAIGRTAAYEAARRGELPAVRIGRSLRVPRHALEQLLNGGANSAPQTNGGAPG
jgi:excisionase family DNA binding protein